jgi:hypothetical protein
MSVTLLQLKDRSRQRADMENSEFVTDAELTIYINGSIAELHDLLVASYGSDYFLSSTTFSTVAGTESYSLPADFYKLMGVDVQVSGSEWASIRPFNFNERNRNQELTWGVAGGPNLRYRVMGSNIRLSPAPNSAVSVKVWYTPKATALSADADTLDDLNGFADYVIIDAAIKMLQKQDDDVTVLMAQKADLKRRIEIMAQNRDAGTSDSVSDVYAENNNFWGTNE